MANNQDANSNLAASGYAPELAGAQALGGVMTGVSNTLNGYYQNQGNAAYNKSVLNSLQGLTPMIQSQLQTQQGLYGNYGQEAQSAQDSATGAANDQYYNQTAQQFKPETNVQSYLNPQIGYQMQQATRGLDSSAAASGGLFSSGHAALVNSQNQGLANQNYQQAFNNMQSMNTLNSGNYENILNNSLQRRQQRNSMLTSNVASTQAGLGQLSNAQNTYSNNMQNNQLMQGQAQGNINAANSANQNTLGRAVLSSLGQGLSNI